MPTSYAEAMREGFDHLRENVQDEQTASILRYTVANRDPVVGVSGTATLVTGLADLQVRVEDPSPRDLQLARGRFDVKDKIFVFYDIDIFLTDKIKHQDSEYVAFGFQKVPGTGMVRVLGRRTDAEVSASA